MTDPIFDGLQQAVNRDANDWVVSHYLCVVGLSRVDDAGNVESAVCLYCAEGQAAYITDGLFWHGQEIHQGVGEEAE